MSKSTHSIVWPFLIYMLIFGGISTVIVLLSFLVRHI